MMAMHKGTVSVLEPEDGQACSWLQGLLFDARLPKCVRLAGKGTWTAPCAHFQSSTAHAPPRHAARACVVNSLPSLYRDRQ